MDEGIPRILQMEKGETSEFFIEIEYFQENVVGEHVDRHWAYIGRFSVGSGNATNGIR